MKRIYLLISLLCLFAMSSRAQLLYEPFNYTPHATLGLSVQSGVVWQTVNTGDSILVEAGSLSYAGLAASTGNKVKFDDAGTDYYRIFTAQTSGSVYTSFILNVTALGGMTTAGGSYFSGLNQTGSTTAFGATVFTRLSATAGRYNVGIATRSNSTISWLAADLVPGTPVFIVTAYDIIGGTANDVARIWLNTSAIGAAEPGADATAAPGTDLSGGVERTFLRQANAAGTPFIQFDELRVGTSWTSVTPAGVAAPALSISTTLPAFGNQCINTTGGPNSFTISGTNLTNADVTVAALTGFTYSTTSGGTYTATLTLPQAGGAFTQQVFVKFDPTAVQSYNGNIVVAGGGAAASVNAAATGAGINNAPTVTTGAASAVTTVSATAAGTITATGCTAVTAYGIEYGTISGGPYTQVPSTNLSGGNFTSDLLTLSPATVYYYRSYAVNGGGTSYGTEQTFTTASLAPSVTTDALTGFGNVCINTTPAANSFTITGSNLTAANVDVAALTGYTYSTTLAGTYTTTLSIAQPGGSFSQQIFVKFTPTAVQSYNGNITISGGGLASPVDVVTVGAGVNSGPTVTTGASSAVTTTTATLAGSIPGTGCSAVTAYGIEYSTTNNFPTGTGTQSVSANLSGGNFSSNLTLLTPSTTYYYRAYATNAGGTVYGAQQSFTTAAPPPPALTATTLAAIGPVCLNTPSNEVIFTINGTNLTTAPITVGPLAGYMFRENGVGGHTATLTINQTGGTQSKNVHVILFPTAAQSYNGNIPVTGGGTTGTLTVPVTGSGVNTVATITTNAATNVTTNSAVVSGTLVNINCSNITTRGIEFSGINGFANGTGTPVMATGGGFTVTLTGLVPNTTYYYKAFGDNNGGRGYGAQQSFTTLPIGDGFRIFPSPVVAGSDITVTANNLKPGYYGVLFFNSGGQLVLQKNIHVQNNYINQTILIPGSIGKGVYRVHFVNNDEVIEQRSILVR